MLQARWLFAAVLVLGAAWGCESNDGQDEPEAEGGAAGDAGSSAEPRAGSDGESVGGAGGSDGEGSAGNSAGSEADPGGAGGGAGEPTDRGPGEPIDVTRKALVIAGNGGDPENPHVFEPEYDDAQCPAADQCEDNSAPELGEPIIEINGRVYPDLSDVRNGDELMILFPVTDAECNLACGTNQSSYSSPEEEGGGAQGLPSNLPCASVETDEYLAAGFSIPYITSDDPDSLEGRVDHYVVTVAVRDVCNTLSNTLNFEFDVQF